MANCEIPDLDLLPQNYNIKSIQFSAGMENSALHLSIWLVSWITRIFPFINLQKYSSIFLKLSNLFNFFGTDDGGMHMIIKGKDKNNKLLAKKWFIIAKNSDGPNIPSIPAIIIAKKLYKNQIKVRGAMPCLGLVSLKEYLKELEEFDINTYNF